jgi:asparagine synthase (glutamine-hydrolysing)
MCGIAGIYSRGDGPIDESRLRAMQADLIHRGPDAAGLRVGPHIGLAFRRLAIIDLSSSANQPMASDEGDVWVIFNGEIYNFREVRSELERLGRRFRTRSDTEVIVQGYQEWGIEVFQKLNGMFAVGLWDGSREELFLVRDRVGKKPLYYREAGGEVIFASEVRALVVGMGETPAVDPTAIDLYLTYLCVPGDRSIYEGVRKVPPASIVRCSRTALTVSRYWRVSYRDKDNLKEREALQQLEEILTDATRIRMISDVPLGAFLSGGVDSSTIVALMSRITSPVRTFSIGMGTEDFNELPYARRVAEACGTRHEEIIVEPDAAAILPRLVWHYGEPFADSSAVPTYYVSAAAHKVVTVALNGDGGDEGFAGYQWHSTIRAAEALRRYCPEILRRRVFAPFLSGASCVLGAPGPLASLARLANRSASTPAESFWIWPGFTPAERALLYAPGFWARIHGHEPERYSRRAYESADGSNDLDRALQVGLETYLPDDLLVKVDIASMANSLEARSPLLDYRVLEFAARLPIGLNVKFLETKHLLKALASRLVPREVVHRQKRGFAVPIGEWLRGPLMRPLRVMLGHPRFQSRGLFNQGVVAGMIERHLAGEDYGAKLWALLWLELWFRMFIDRDISREDSLLELC